MLPVYISHPDCARHEMGPGHSECPERLSAVADRARGPALAGQGRARIREDQSS